MNLRHRRIALVCWGALCWLAPLAHAAALTDGTVGPVQNLAGNFTVPQTLGTIAGNNLYHSFQSFNIGAAESATFTTTSAALANVISRVTGGQVSNIQGTLRLTPAAGSAPNFYFINPAGVTFGNGAVVDVPAAFHVSTAQRLNFADGSQWDTSAPTVSGLSAAAPESFGFLLSTAVGKVTFNNRNLATGTIVSECAGPGSCHDMQMKNGAYTDIVAGNVELEDTNLYTTGASNFRVVAVGSGSVTVPINGEPSGTSSGTLTMQRAILATENGPSTIDVRAGNIALENDGEIYTINLNSPLNGGSIDVRAGSALSLRAGAEIGTVTFGNGSAANLNIQSATLSIAGNDYDTITGISTDTNGAGPGGNITINVSGPISVQRGGLISASTRNNGNAGTIGISAASLTVDRSGSPVTVVSGHDKYRTGIFNDAMNAGTAGSVSITATGEVAVRDGGLISSGTSSTGAAGSVSISSARMTIDGVPAIPLFTGVKTQAETGSTGRAGTVTVTVNGLLTIREAGAITSDTFGAGAAGNVAVSAGQITMDGAGAIYFTGISSEAGIASGGQAGNVSVRARDSLSLANSAQLSIRSDPLVAAPNALVLTRLDATAPTIVIADKASITAAAIQNAHASRIVIDATDSFTLTRAAITTSARDGNGGPIALSAGRVGYLLDSRVTTSVTGVSGNGGDIDIRAPYLVMQTGFIQANTTAALASGGLINIDVANLIPSAGNLALGGSVIRSFQPGRFGDNVVQAAAPTGINGVIMLSAPQIDLSATLAPLNTAVVDLRSLIAAACQMPTDSSLSVLSRGGLPPGNTGPLRPEPR